MTETNGGVDWRARTGELAAKLAADGVITDPVWRSAVENIPRHVFVPRFWALDRYNAPQRLVDGADPGAQTEWLDAVYSDRFLATQWVLRDGHRTITSSASQPTLVARMLHLLDMRDHDRVLEIGSGTGYNTALLCHRLGDTAVVSIDIDAVLVAEAQERLARLGYRPQLRTGDGAQGVELCAPYSRILSTCASPGVPAAWITQLADHGRLVAPFTIGGALAVLTKTGPDQVCGHLASEPAWFIPLRPADRPLPDHYFSRLPEPPPQHRQYTATTQVDPDAFADPDFRLWLCLHLPPDARVVDIVNPTDTGVARTGVIIHTTEYRASAELPPGSITGPWQVTQDERRLFDTVETAWHAWRGYGRPERTRLGITAHADGTQQAWLDSPTSGMSWPLPT